jgi:hypothetical protein
MHTVGWVDIGTRTILPVMFVIYISKVLEIDKNKCFDPVTASSWVTTFWVMQYIRVQNFFFTIWALWVSKEFYVDFKSVNFP